MGLKHSFKDKIDVDEFSHDNSGLIVTVDRFCQQVDRLSAKYKATIPPEDFKGHSLELLVEYLLLNMGMDNRIGIYDYQPVKVGDTGVDGFGLGEDGNPATVQVKYRSDPTYVLTADQDHVTNFPLASFMKYGVPLDSTKNMLLITTGKGVHYYTLEEMLLNKVRVLGREHLKALLDKRPEWWERFFETIKEDQIAADPDALPRVVLRKHQNAAVSAWKDFPEDSRGKITCPTGTGKTYIQSEIAYEVIRAKGSPVIQINTSRILLCWQILEEVFKYLISCGIHNAVYVNYNSGSFDEEEYVNAIRLKGGIYNKILSSTSTEDVRKKHQLAKAAGVPLVIVSTYHSATKLASSGIVPDVVFHDEAHNLVAEEFSRIPSLNPCQQLFFTATEKETRSEHSFGMNNVDIFGSTVYEVSPREMIEAGEMLPPWIHIIQPDQTQTYDKEKLDNDYEAMFSSIVNAFLAHNNRVKEDSVEPDAIGAKMLSVLRGQEELKALFQTKAYARFRRQFPNVHFFALSTDYGVRCDDDYWPAPVSSVKKQTMLDRLKALTAPEQAIVFHIDMIGEGIDVPGITGIMLFRNLCDVKLYQNIGRACRLLGVDRGRLYAGDISVEDQYPWIKPRAWIILPDLYAGAQDAIEKTKDLVAKLRTEYGFQSRTSVFIDTNRGLFEPEELEPINPPDDSLRSGHSGLDEFINTYEDIVDILHQDQVSRLRRKRVVAENLVARMLRHHEIPEKFEEIYPDHFLANLLFVYLHSRCEDFTWDKVTPEVQAIFEQNVNLGGEMHFLWRHVVTLLDANFPRYSAANKELMNYMQLNYESWLLAIANREPEIIDMAKSCLSSTVAKKQFGEVFTPIALVDEMLDKLPVELWSNPDLKWIDPAMGSGNFLMRVYDRLMDGLASVMPDSAARRKHILENMIYGVELQPKNVLIALMFLDPEGEFDMHLEIADSLVFGYWGGMKFDVVVGNPPYQEAREKGAKGRGHALWAKFVIKAFSFLSPNGFLVFVHPSGWRNVISKYSDPEYASVRQLLLEKQLMFLSIHNEKDGIETFGAETRYDWYCCKNTPRTNGFETLIDGQDGCLVSFDLFGLPFIPNGCFSQIFSLVAKEGDDKVCILSDSTYHTQREYVSKEKDHEYLFPCIYTVPKGDIPKLHFSSRNDKGHFGVPKMVWSNGRIISVGSFIDDEGEYGLTQFSYAIVDTPENLPYIKQAFDSSAFRSLMEMCSILELNINCRIIAEFRKNWWTEFVTRQS